MVTLCLKVLRQIVRGVVAGAGMAMACHEGLVVSGNTLGEENANLKAEIQKLRVELAR